MPSARISRRKPLIIACLVVTIGSLGWFASRRKDAAVVPVPHTPASTSVPVEAVSPKTPALEPAVPVARPAPAVFGANGPVTMQDIPAGRFRDELLALPEEIRRSALKNLGDLKVPVNNIRSLRVDRNGWLYFECALAVAAASGISYRRVSPADPRTPSSATPSGCTVYGSMGQNELTGHFEGYSREMTSTPTAPVSVWRAIKFGPAGEPITIRVIVDPTRL